MKKVVILGHEGMLGSCVINYLRLNNIDTYSVPHRFPDPKMGDIISFLEPDFVINCIGSIPQKTQCFEVNYAVPIYLVTLAKKVGFKIIHPSSDCEFSGEMPVGDFYSSTDAQDANEPYGLSKITGTNIILKSGLGKVIRTSIIGFENKTKFSLLEWFLSNPRGSHVDGYLNHYWNGITTLKWAEVCLYIINNYDSINTSVIQIGTEPVTKFDLLNIFNEVFGRDIKVNPVYKSFNLNRCLKSNLDLNFVNSSIAEQLLELKNNENSISRS